MAVWSMDFMTSKEAAKLWNLTPRRVSQMCRMGYIEGVQKVGTAWIMPKDTKKPYDRRVSSGKYIGVKRNRK